MHPKICWLLAYHLLLHIIDGVFCLEVFKIDWWHAHQVNVYVAADYLADWKWHLSMWTTELTYVDCEVLSDSRSKGYIRNYLKTPLSMVAKKGAMANCPLHGLHFHSLICTLHAFQGFYLLCNMQEPISAHICSVSLGSPTLHQKRKRVWFGFPAEIPLEYEN